MKQNLSALWSLRRAIARREARRPVRVCRYTLPGRDRFRLVHLTDLHLDDRTDWNALSRLVEQVNRQHPDVVVFTGDLVCHPEPFRQWKTAAEILRRIQAPCGVFAVRGNHDLFGRGQQAQRLFEKSGFVLLKTRWRGCRRPAAHRWSSAGWTMFIFKICPTRLPCFACGMRRESASCWCMSRRWQKKFHVEQRI